MKQVEIEAKFLGVSQNDLDEVGFDWTGSRTSPNSSQIYTSQGRNLNGTLPLIQRTYRL